MLLGWSMERLGLNFIRRVWKNWSPGQVELVLSKYFGSKFCLMIWTWSNIDRFLIV